MTCFIETSKGFINVNLITFVADDPGKLTIFSVDDDPVDGGGLVFEDPTEQEKIRAFLRTWLDKPVGERMTRP